MKQLLIFILTLQFFLCNAQDSLKNNINFIKVHVAQGSGRHLNPYDGDGCKVIFPNGKIVKVRFVNFDAPEIKNLSFYAGVDTAQPYAYKSRDVLASIIANKDILLDTLPFSGLKAKWSYDRMLVDPYTLDSSLITLNLIEQGCGWYVETLSKRVNSKIAFAFKDVFEIAKTKKSGLWKLKGRKYSPSYWKKIYRNKPRN